MKRYIRRTRLAKSQKTKDAFEQRLAPLKQGIAIALALNGESRHGKVLRTVHRLVLVSPGVHYGMRKGCYVVSVVGKGSCVIDTATTKGLAELVKAGIPLNLSKALLSKLISLAGE